MCPQVSRFVIYLSELTSVMQYVCVCVWVRTSERVHLFIQSLVVFKERLQSFEDLHLAGDSRWWGCLSFYHCHSQTTFVTRHQTLQVLQQQLQHEHTHTNVCMTKENTNSRNIVCFHQRQTHARPQRHTRTHIDTHTLVLFLSAFSSDISSSFSSSCSRHMFSSFVRVANSYTTNTHTTPIQRLILYH